MLIESMNLYYHLACFVCSRCGVALSDGLSNTDVRIRCGQLYCNDCYPSRQSKGIQQLGAGSHRNRNTIARTNNPVNCSDRRSRPRSQCNQPRGNSATSGNVFFTSCTSSYFCLCTSFVGHIKLSEPQRMPPVVFQNVPWRTYISVCLR